MTMRDKFTSHTEDPNELCGCFQCMCDPEHYRRRDLFAFCAGMEQGRTENPPTWVDTIDPSTAIWVPSSMTDEEAEAELNRIHPLPPELEDKTEKITASKDETEMSGTFTTNTEPSERLSSQHTGQARWAYILAEKHPDEIMYVADYGWHRYDGTRWVEDLDGAVATRLVLQLLRTRRSQENVDQDTLREIISCERASGINGVLSIASKLPQLHRTVADLDADPNLLNTANGTVDLLTGEFRPHDPADRITKVTRAACDPDATSKTWTKFLASSLPDAEVRGFLQRYLGYALSGRVTEHVLCILFGEGRNGKGVFYEALTYALGSYADAAVPELFLENKGMHKTFEMSLRGLRLVTVSETGQGAQLAAATVKRLVGGDRITANLMRRNPVTFTPSHSPLLVTNHLPKVRGDDPALWARLRVVPFDVVIPEADRVKDLPQRLEIDADAVLAWMLAGRRDYLDRGDLAAPEAVKVATAGYRRAQDAIEQFLEQVTEKDPSGKAEFPVLYQRWTAWADRNDFPPLAKGEFKKALESREIAVRKGTGGKNFVYGYTITGPKLKVSVDGQ
ncbi:DNA primase family protein [Rhodococcus sp. LB1]|uniref:DNA primase family protein n=1 Tax=Rhodococcus sp. LB1 TaxID=1807499 RepID=UPI001E5103E7|nr:phage/plasmid primase, P4 family [Rhodococcus sp. LB1]